MNQSNTGPACERSPRFQLDLALHLHCPEVGGERGDKQGARLSHLTGHGTASGSDTPLLLSLGLAPPFFRLQTPTAHRLK